MSIIDITEPEAREFLQRWIGTEQTGDLNDPSTVRHLIRTVVGAASYLDGQGVVLTEGGGPDEAIPDPPAILPDPQTVRLPHERDLDEFYGPAQRDGSNQEWFNFPSDDMLLYSRTGAPLTDHDGDEFDDHRCHRDVVEPLEAAFVELAGVLGWDRFRAEGWHVFGGVYNYRRKTGGSSLSTHAWGIAIDVNPGENPFAAHGTTFSSEAIAIMEKHGFLSGGRAWGKDWMHFQRAIPYISDGSYYDREGLPRHIREA